MTIDPLDSDPVYLALTRPPMRWGVTYSALLVCGVVSIECFLMTGHLLGLLVWLPLHGSAWLLCRREPRFFDLLLLRARTRGTLGTPTRHDWGMASYGPHVARPRRSRAARAGAPPVILP